MSKQANMASATSFFDNVVVIVVEDRAGGLQQGKFLGFETVLHSGPFKAVLHPGVQGEKESVCALAGVPVSAQLALQPSISGPVVCVRYVATAAQTNVSIPRSSAVRVGASSVLLGPNHALGPHDSGAHSHLLRFADATTTDRFLTQLQAAARGSGGADINIFDRKTDSGSAAMYFHYYVRTEQLSQTKALSSRQCLIGVWA